MSRVCAKCFDDDDIAAHINLLDGEEGCEPGCDYCGLDDAPTIDMDELGEFLRDRMSLEYGQAVEQLPYESAEGGYQGWHRDSWDMIFDEGIIALARHSDELLKDLVDAIDSDAIWCDWDWLSLDDDAAMALFWDSFAQVVKYQRHFFFERPAPKDDREHLTPLTLMRMIASRCDELGLVVTLPAETYFYRARPRAGGATWTTPAELGPPAAPSALQFNRMNAPGNPVLYVSETEQLCLAEKGNGSASVAQWKTTRPMRVLDLADLPAFPGLFSSWERKERLELRFLHRFVDEITKPVAGDREVKLDYIPTQAFSEFLRDYKFREGSVDGVRYPSATGTSGANVVLFASQRDVVGGSPCEDDPPSGLEPWLELTEVKQL